MLRSTATLGLKVSSPPSGSRDLEHDTSQLSSTMSQKLIVQASAGEDFPAASKNVPTSVVTAFFRCRPPRRPRDGPSLESGLDLEIAAGRFGTPGLTTTTSEAARCPRCSSTPDRAMSFRIHARTRAPRRRRAGRSDRWHQGPPRRRACRRGFACENQRSLRLDRDKRARRMEMIQKRTMIFGSAHPFFS